MNRKLWFQHLFQTFKLTELEVAESLGIQPVTLRKKLLGYIKFSEKDIKIILGLLDMKFEEVFK